ncbi:UDP-N-acetylmuramoyl-L-alanine--D-glutamate ligase [Rugosimonospora africana]|uniref:UDP-N-acetylmuramoylalanine--D-glutamate ligase n=1 Tax=Rugosimonospora africana TaxID=556532 RepID=A0A8J3R2M7_9ACTN|nr:UDP-N-acetylmuramoyl-L-alanine--D-glutamate ligase [Rugosimonospora africana]GIH19056.1 UDP-N-acetylmuramoylalanine--D-glutamate ligase [Rugosimonospora africana]
MNRVLIGGAGVAGVAAARVLRAGGADVTLVSAKSSAGSDELADEGVAVVIADPAPIELLDGIDELVVSPGFTPRNPLVTAALDRGLEVYSEPELAWRLRGAGAPDWLGITGTNGKTTTTTMLAAILTAAGLSAAALGNIGEPLVFAASGISGPGHQLAGTPSYEVLAVELSSFQLHWSRDLAPRAGALLNLAEDHLDWHGSFEAYAQAKEAIWRAATPEGGGVAVGNLDDPRVAEALSRVTGRTVGFTLAAPNAGELGVRDGWLYDDAFGGGRLVEATAIRPPGAHNVSNALAAAALALSYGVGPAAVRDGLAGYRPEGHRNAYVATVAGVDYVDDSKATNPHAAYASLTAYPRVVWVAGGQLKGVDVGELVASVADRLAGAVLLGVDRAQVAQALARHAPQVPVVDVASVDDGAMGEVVRAAAELARPGDTVLLAPAAASLDMYPSYARRGDAFAAAVGELAERAGEPARDGRADRDPGGAPR